MAGIVIKHNVEFVVEVGIRILFQQYFEDIEEFSHKISTAKFRRK